MYPDAKPGDFGTFYNEKTILAALRSYIAADETHMAIHFDCGNSLDTPRQYIPTETGEYQLSEITKRKAGETLAALMNRAALKCLVFEGLIYYVQTDGRSIAVCDKPFVACLP